MYLVIWIWKNNNPWITSYVCVYEDRRQAERDIVEAKHKLGSLKENQERMPETYDPQDSVQTYKHLQKIFADLGWPEQNAPGSNNKPTNHFLILSVFSIHPKKF